MSSPRYSVWIGKACCLGAGMPYETLLIRVMEFTVRGAIAKSTDQSVWEHEELRKHGIHALRVLAGAAEVDPQFHARLDRDLCARWRRLGYQSESLGNDMKALFSELENDAAQAAADARGCLLAELVSALQEMR